MRASFLSFSGSSRRSGFRLCGAASSRTLPVAALETTVSAVAAVSAVTVSAVASLTVSAVSTTLVVVPTILGNGTGARDLREDFSLVDPHLYADLSVGGIRLCKAVINVGAQGLQRNVRYARSPPRPDGRKR